MTALFAQGRVAFGNLGSPLPDQLRICEASLRVRSAILLEVFLIEFSPATTLFQIPENASPVPIEL